MVQQLSPPSLALSFLFHRLKWPVPMSRWRTAREIRNLLCDPATRSLATDALIDYLGKCKTESEVCELLNIVFLTPPSARPRRTTVVSRIQCSSILADMILERIYGPGSGVGNWHFAHSGRIPEDFSIDAYFDKYKAAYVPPVIYNNLIKLEDRTGYPFVLQWAYEWNSLRDKLSTSHTDYPYYFDSALDVRSNIKGQYWQRMREVYLSAYLRTICHAVCEWHMPKIVAEESCVKIVHGIAGLFDVEPSGRPGWLADLPERFCVPDADFQALVRDLVQNARVEGMRLVSLNTPVALSVFQYANLTLSAHLVTPDFEMSGEDFLNEITVRLSVVDTFKLKKPLNELTFAAASTEGRNGIEAPVCFSLFPMPFGTWQSDYLSMGLNVPAPYVVNNAEIQCTSEAIVSMLPGDFVASKTIVWNDNWMSSCPSDGTTRCGTSTMMNCELLAKSIERLGVKLAFFVRLHTWSRTTDYGPYIHSESNAFMFD